MTESGCPKFLYSPALSHLHPLTMELEAVWVDYRTNLEFFRKSYHEFNLIFVDQKQHTKSLVQKKQDLYSNLFLLISIT